MPSAHDSEVAGDFPRLDPRDASNLADAEFVIPLLTPGRRKLRAQEGAGLGMRASPASSPTRRPSCPAPHAWGPAASSAPRGDRLEYRLRRLLHGQPGCLDRARLHLRRLLHRRAIGNDLRLLRCGGRGVCRRRCAVLLPKVRIGRNAVIAAGAVVTRDVASRNHRGRQSRQSHSRDHIAGYRDIGV
jgi:hypothetical protein